MASKKPIAKKTTAKKTEQKTLEPLVFRRSAG